MRDLRDDSVKLLLHGERLHTSYLAAACSIFHLSLLLYYTNVCISTCTYIFSFIVACFRIIVNYIAVVQHVYRSFDSTRRDAIR